MKAEKRVIFILTAVLCLCILLDCIVWGNNKESREAAVAAVTESVPSDEGTDKAPEPADGASAETSSEDEAPAAMALPEQESSTGAVTDASEEADTLTEETESAVPETESSLPQSTAETPEETKPAQTAPFAAQKNGFIREGGNTYYYVNGTRRTGFQIIGGKRYYFNSAGVMLKNTTFDRYIIDANGVCTDRFRTITASNLAAYTDYLLGRNGRSLKGAFDYIWKNYVYRYAPRIGTLGGMTEANRTAMICRFLNNGTGPCTDFAYTLQYFCERLGYQARVVTGEGMNHNEHDWVLVQVSPGVWRHMDALYKTQYLYLLTDEQLMRFDGDTYRFRWDRNKWTTSTASGTGGAQTPAATSAQAPETTNAPETTEAPETTAPQTTAPETTAPPPETTAPATEAPSSSQPTEASSEPTQAPTSRPATETSAPPAPTEASTSSETAASSTAAEESQPPEDPSGEAARSGEDLVAEP